MNLMKASEVVSMHDCVRRGKLYFYRVESKFKNYVIEVLESIVQ